MPTTIRTAGDITARGKPIRSHADSFVTIATGARLTGPLPRRRPGLWSQVTGAVTAAILALGAFGPQAVKAQTLLDVRSARGFARVCARFTTPLA